MKTCVAFTATALIIAATFDSAMGLAKYLDELPNGSSFTQELGHPDNDSSQYTKFATAFADAGHSWTADFCAATFPGSDMTNGAAFGDPCCTWKKGGKPDFTVTGFTTTPGEATVCASTAGSSTETPPATDAPSTNSLSTTAPVTNAPATTSPPTTAPSTTDPPAYTDVPAATTPPPTTGAPETVNPASGGCVVKPDHDTNRGQSYRRFRH
ncbi:unnamed protein product [Phytophthora lilii]|uniref:Unnamed protein product n=1 Tax=Phytophthora lilii TaxID=2077276 RepID=A0A9W6WRA7_9STRA|nr:unnamed protein product [Phytophthora lilii]